jgi:hypothetical protein
VIAGLNPDPLECEAEMLTTEVKYLILLETFSTTEQRRKCSEPSCNSAIHIFYTIRIVQKWDVKLV